MKLNFGKRTAALALALLLLLPVLPLSVFAVNPALNVTPAPGFTVYRFDGATDDAANGTPVADNVIDLSQTLYFLTGNNVQMGAFCLWPVEGDELPPATICNSGYNGKEYSSELLSLSHVNSSSLMAGTILGKNVGYDWDVGRFYANEGYTLKYMAAGEYYPEPGTYRFLMFYSNSVYYSDVYTITDDTGLTADQGVAEAVWIIDDHPASVIPYNPDEGKTAFDMSILLPADVSGISSVRLLRADYDMFGSDSYFWFGVNRDGDSFQVGKMTDEGVFDEGHCFLLENCEVSNMTPGSYRVKVIAGDGRAFIDNTVAIVKEVSTDPPIITTSSLPSGKAEEPYSAYLEATPVSGGKISWSLSGKLPDGLSLSSGGVISGTPEKTGRFAFAVRASEEGGGYADKDYAITITEADLKLKDDAYFGYDSVGEQIKYESSYSLGMAFNRPASSGETASATVYYKTVGGSTKTVGHDLDTYGWAGASGSGQLPTDASSVEKVEFFLNGELVYTKTVEKTVAPAIELNVTGSSGQYLYLGVYDESGECVAGYSVGYSGKTFNINSLPSGTYRFMLSGSIYGFGYQNYGETTVTLGDGQKQNVTLPIVNHYATRITLESDAEGKGYCNATYEWYADPEGKELLQTGDSRTLLDDEAVYVRAIPKYSTTVTNLPTDLIRVDRGGSTTGYRTVKLTLPKKQTAAVSISALCEQLDGSAPARGYYTVSVTRYGDPGYSDSNYYSPDWRNGETLSLNGLTEGTKIILTGGTGWGSFSYVVTAEDAARGTLDLRPTVPLADGLIRWSVTQTDAAGTRPFWNLSYLDQVRIRKADGTELGIVRRDEFLLLTEPEKVSVGETLTIVGWRGDSDYPYAYGEATFTVTKDSGGRRTGTAALPIVDRGRVYFDLDRGEEVPAITLLIYGADGNLIYQKRNAESGNWNYHTVGIATPYLPAGFYFAGAAPSVYIDGLEPGEYDTAAELALKPYAVLRETGLVGFGTVNLGTLELPTGFRGGQLVNLDLSGVSMTKAQNECFRLDITVTPRMGFTLDSGRNVTLYIKTNQQGTNSWGGHVSTRSLSVNGIPLDINRWSGNGTLQDNGTITLELTPAQIEELGGFPLKLSTTCYQLVDEKLEASAYLRFWQGGTFHSDYIGSFSEPTGALTLTVPNMITDGSFTVYGRGPAMVNPGDPYTVTLYLDGRPVASGVTDTQRGYYRINVNLDESELSPLQTLRFTASGSYHDGIRALTSEEQSALYNPEGAQLQTMVLNWESHQGDFEAGRGQSIVMLNDGDAPNLYGLWYRGGFANDLGKVFWSVTFAGHPEKVEAARVYVPRNGTTECLECTEMPDGSWATEPTYFYGSAPDGAWVEFDCPVEYGYVNDPDGAISAANVADFLGLLSGSESVGNIEGNPMNGDILTFLLGTPEEGQLPVGFSLWNEKWDAAELERFRELELSPNTPNLLSYDEGYMTFGEGADAITVWATDTVYRYVDHDDNSKHLYEETVYTPDFRMVTTWNESARTKQVSILSIGGLGFEDLNFDGITDETLLGFARTAAIQTIWLTFYEEFAYALADAVTAEPDAGGISGVSVARAPALLAPSTQDILNGIKRLEKCKEKFEKIKDDPFTKIVTDSYDWCHGKEIDKYEIRKIKDFLDDNPCLKRLYKFYRSGTDDANNPYRVIAEADAVYYKVGMGELGKIVENAFNAGSYVGGSAKQAAEKLTDAMYKGSVETLSDYAYSKMYEADLFWRQSENLAHDIYIAAKRAEREERGIGGLCNEGIDWRRFPTSLYDYNKYFGYGPNSYLNVTPPPGPQGRYDPSGYVYEAVPSNRVEGAEVTLWQLDGPTETKDGSGEVTSLSGGTPFIIDADLFGIEPNPQITGTDGRYQWFVPSGWWRVTVSKTGFEAGNTGADGGFGIGAVKNATDGNWYMPVLPEQLDVNIPLVSFTAPEVSRILANTKGLFVFFSKYMDESTLTRDRFTLFVNGVETDYDLSLVDSEKSGPADGAPNFTRTVKLTYEGMKEGDVVEVVVDNRVESYAGVAMETRFESDRMTVSAPERAATPTANVPSGEVEKNTAISLIAPTGGTVVRYTVDGSEPNGESPVLTDAIIVTENVTVKAIATGAFVEPSGVLTVSYTIPTPKTAPDRVTAQVDGKPVYDGDTIEPGKLTFTCSTEGAEIWYTTNGVCPCDDETARNRYTSPVDLTPGTYFFRVRAQKDGIWSEGLPLHLTVKAPLVNPFTDVKEGVYYYDAVMWAVSHDPQITNGISADKFAPNNTCTRGQVVTFLWRASGEPAPKNTFNPFVDVKKSDYFYQAVLWAVEQGITNGTDKTHFSPNAGCTRGQVVTFLWRANGGPAPSGSANPFKDVKRSDYYFDAVLWAVGNGVTTGTGANTFSPKDTCTRGQIVTFLYRYMG